MILDEQGEGNFRDFVLAERVQDGSVRAFHEIHPYHPTYLLLAYPLMFSNKDHGFHRALQIRNLSSSLATLRKVSLRRSSNPKGATRSIPKGLSAPAAVLSRIPLRADLVTLIAMPLFHN